MATKAFAPLLHKVQYMYLSKKGCKIVTKLLDYFVKSKSCTHCEHMIPNSQTVTGNECVDLANGFLGMYCELFMQCFANCSGTTCVYIVALLHTKACAAS